jgi:hypothetical protein
MMVVRLVLFCLLVGSGLALHAQVRPDFFPEETNPNNSNFEVYSQKNGINRRASLANLRKYFGAQIVTGSVPAPTGNSESLRNKIIVVLPDSITYFVDWNGTSVLLGGGIDQPNGVVDFYEQNDTLYLETVDTVFAVYLPPTDLSAYAETAYVDSLHTDLQDSLAVVATRLDTLLEGQGGIDTLPIWTAQRRLGNSSLSQQAGRLTLGGNRVLRLEGLTTAQLPSAAAGDFYYNTSSQGFGVVLGNTRRYPALCNYENNLFPTAGGIPYSLNGILVNSSALTFNLPVLNLNTTNARFLLSFRNSTPSLTEQSNPGAFATFFVDSREQNMSIASTLRARVSSADANNLGIVFLSSIGADRADNNPGIYEDFGKKYMYATRLAWSGSTSGDGINLNNVSDFFAGLPPPGSSVGGVARFRYAFRNNVARDIRSEKAWGFFDARKSSPNAFWGATIVGDTIEPQRQLELRGGLRVLPDSLQNTSTRLAGWNAAGDATGIVAGEGLTISAGAGSAPDTLNAALSAPEKRFISLWKDLTVYDSLDATARHLQFPTVAASEGSWTRTDSTVQLAPGKYLISYTLNFRSIAIGATKIGGYYIYPALNSSILGFMLDQRTFTDDINALYTTSYTSFVNVESTSELSLQHYVAGATVYADITAYKTLITIEEK